MGLRMTIVKGKGVRRTGGDRCGAVRCTVRVRVQGKGGERKIRAIDESKMTKE